MVRLRVGLFLIVGLILVNQAPGQWMFAKKPKVNPLQRVPELILTVKTDADERKRQHAAEELREFDTNVFTEIVPVLADVLLTDKKQGVRGEALTSLVKIRPVTPLAAQAIEKASASDETLRIRVQAKAALPKYHLTLSMTKKSEPPPTTLTKKTTAEPPLAGPQATPPAPPVVTPPAKKSIDGPSLFPD